MLSYLSLATITTEITRNQLFNNMSFENKNCGVRYIEIQLSVRRTVEFDTLRYNYLFAELWCSIHWDTTICSSNCGVRYIEIQLYVRRTVEFDTLRYNYLFAELWCSIHWDTTICSPNCGVRYIEIQLYVRRTVVFDTLRYNYMFAELWCSIHCDTCYYNTTILYSYHCLHDRFVDRTDNVCVSVY